MKITFDTTYHAPVMVREVVELLGSAKSVLDGTLGGGGHSEALLESGVQRVVGIDRDPEAISAARARLDRFEQAGRFHAVLANYADLAEVTDIARLAVDGVLLDLGVSSRQFDDPARGFTFREGARLDMRMSDHGPSAARLLNESDEGTLATILREYADERHAGRLSREIIRRRATQPFASSDDLVRAVRGALGPRTGPTDFARLFQALRIAVNDELDGLGRALPALRERLNDGGTMVVITYHSGEDRIVKHAFKEWSADCICPPKQPVCTCRGRPLGELLTRRAMTPATEEIERNPRARSAKLRAWRRTGTRD